MPQQPDALQRTGIATPKDGSFQQHAVPPAPANLNTASYLFSHQEGGTATGNGHPLHTGIASPGVQASQARPAFIPGTLPYSEFPDQQAAGGFPPNGTYPGFPGSGITAGKSNSSLHAALIVTMVFIGLAIGLANFIWANDKREAKRAEEILAKNMTVPSVADQASTSSGPTLSPGSSDSGLDSYPPELRTESRPPPNGPLDQELVGEKNGVKLDGYLTPSLSLPQALERMKKEEQLLSDAPSTSESAKTEKAKPEVSDNPAPSKAVVQSEKKRKSRTDTQAGKLAAAERKEKERLREIDRVRTQAYSESSKDRIGERKSGSDNPIGPQSERRRPYRSQLAQKTVTSSEYARCERSGNLIDRERCKWQLCNNKWGKGGCPSFKPERSYIF
jgi:hypothetical protein